MWVPLPYLLQFQKYIITIKIIKHVFTLNISFVTLKNRYIFQKKRGHIFVKYGRVILNYDQKQLKNARFEQKFILTFFVSYFFLRALPSALSLDRMASLTSFTEHANSAITWASMSRTIFLSKTCVFPYGNPRSGFFLSGPDLTYTARSGHIW